MLHLNASKVEHLVRLASEQGLAEFYAKQTIATTSGDTLTETVGNDRIQVVEDKHETITTSAEIHYQSATDVLLRGANNIELKSGHNIELEAGHDMTLDIREATRIRVGGIKIDPAGNITLFGTNVNFAGAVSLSGKVNMDITSPPSVSLASGVGATAAIGIGNLSGNANREAAGNWVDLEYLYADNSGVAGACYQLYDSANTVIAVGTLDGNGKAHVLLPEDTTDLSVTFGSDPDQVATLEASEPQPVPQTSGWYQRMSSKLQEIWHEPGSAGHTWGTITGEFNEEFTIGQLATNTILTSMPLLDATQDGRLLSSIYRMLLWDRRYEDDILWQQFYLTLTRQIADYGELYSTVLKQVANQYSFERVCKTYNHFRKGNVVAWLKTVKDEDLETPTGHITQLAHDQVVKLIQLFQDQKATLPQKHQNLITSCNSILDTLHAVEERIDDQFFQLKEKLVTNLVSLLASREPSAVSGSSCRTLQQKQRLEQPEKALYLPQKSFGKDVESYKTGIILTDGRDKTWSNVKYELQIGNDLRSGTVGADGKIEIIVPKDITEGVLSLWPYQERPGLKVVQYLSFNSLPQVSEGDGVEMRLNNQACPLSKAAEPSEQMAARLSYFQQRHDLEPTGQLDAATLAILTSYEQC